VPFASFDGALPLSPVVVSWSNTVAPQVLAVNHRWCKNAIIQVWVQRL